MVTTDMGLCKGGIQIWAHYINKLFAHEKLSFDYFVLKETSLAKIFKLFKANFSCSKFILMDWKKMIFVIFAFFLTNIGLKKGTFFVFVFGDEIMNIDRKRKKIIEYLARKKFVKFIADSKSIGNIFKDIVYKEIDHVCYPFIDIQSMINGINEQKTGTNKNHYTFFTVTRLVSRKNIKNVIKALHEIKKENSLKFRYYIAGDGPEKELIAKQVRDLEMTDEIIILGNISEETKFKYFNESDLFFLPSLYKKDQGSIEGFGIVFIEANAFGVPVISGNTGGMTEAVIDGVTGLYCDGSVEDIVDKIENFAEYKFDRESIIEHARKFDYRNQREFLDYIRKF